MSLFPGVVDSYSMYYVPTDQKHMTVLSYANGPGGIREGEDRPNPTNDITGGFGSCTNEMNSVLGYDSALGRGQHGLIK